MDDIKELLEQLELAIIVETGTHGLPQLPEEHSVEKLQRDVEAALEVLKADPTKERDYTEYRERYQQILGREHSPVTKVIKKDHRSRWHKK